MRELILVTFETSSYERFLASRPLRNFSPKSPTGPRLQCDAGNIIGQAAGARHRPTGLGAGNVGSLEETTGLKPVRDLASPDAALKGPLFHGAWALKGRSSAAGASLR